MWAKIVLVGVGFAWGVWPGRALELEDVDGFREAEVAVTDEFDRAVPHGFGPSAGGGDRGAGLPARLRMRVSLGRAHGTATDAGQPQAYPASELRLALERDTSLFAPDYKEVTWSAAGGTGGRGPGGVRGAPTGTA